MENAPRNCNKPNPRKQKDMHALSSHGKPNKRNHHNHHHHRHLHSQPNRMHHGHIIMHDGVPILPNSIGPRHRGGGVGGGHPHPHSHPYPPHNVHNLHNLHSHRPGPQRPPPLPPHHHQYQHHQAQRSMHRGGYQHQHPHPQPPPQIVYVPMPMQMSHPLYLSVAASKDGERYSEHEQSTSASETATPSANKRQDAIANNQEVNVAVAVALASEEDDSAAELVELTGSMSSISLASSGVHAVVQTPCDSDPYPNASTMAVTPASTPASASAPTIASTSENDNATTKKKQGVHYRKRTRNGDGDASRSKASGFGGNGGHGQPSNTNGTPMMDHLHHPQQQYQYQYQYPYPYPQPQPHWHPHMQPYITGPAPLMVYVPPPPPHSHVAHGMYEIVPHPHAHLHPHAPFYFNHELPLLSMPPDYTSLSSTASPSFVPMEMESPTTSSVPDSPFSRGCTPMPPPPAALAPQQQQERGIKLVAIDVECAKNGYGHLDLVPCRIAMVDQEGHTLFDEFVRIADAKIPMTQFTGLTLQQIQTQGRPLREVLHAFHALLREFHSRHEGGVWIVGQSLCLDVVWTALQRGVHYTGVIDIAHIFKTPRSNADGEVDQWTFYSLRNTAWHALGATMNAHYHSPVEDAKMSMQLYNEICCQPDELFRHRQNLMKMAQNSSLKYSKYGKMPLVGEWQGNCSAAFGGFCICGQDVLTAERDVDDEHCLADIRALYAEKTCIQQPIKIVRQHVDDEHEHVHMHEHDLDEQMYRDVQSVLS